MTPRRIEDPRVPRSSLWWNAGCPDSRFPIQRNQAFGDATCLTVSQMLTYAASQSNAGGSVWYGNVKATQELAKDSFETVNQQAAFTCL